MLRSIVTKVASRVQATTQQSRGYKDGRKGLQYSWNGFYNFRSHGGPQHHSQMWMHRGTPPRNPESKIITPRGTMRHRPFQDPYKFKYVGAKVDAQGKVISNRMRDVRENLVRHEFRSVLAERNFHGFPLLHYQRKQTHLQLWNLTTSNRGTFY